ncbi:MAG TPA: pitrilysin family protein [Polyangiales bacterium]|nr:pitrilysin family protein [Polyangiales bacterium]
MSKTLRHDVLLVEESHDLPLVHFQIVIASGSIEDAAGKEGLSRLSARMLRRGSKQRDTRKIEDTIDGLGAELGIEAGANYVRISGSCIKRSLDKTLALVGELLNEPSFPESELAQLKRETLAALLELTDSDQALCSIHFRRGLFKGHLYGRPSLGTPGTLARIELDDVIARYREGLITRPRAIGFSGDITYAEASKLVDTHLARSAPISSYPTEPSEPTQVRGRQLRIVDKPERTQTQILIGRLASHPRDEDHTALLVGNAVFGGAFTARLMRAVRSERGWSYGASSRVGMDKVREAWSMHTFPAATDAAPCIELQLALMDEWVGKGIDDKELEFAQSYLMKSHAFSIDTADKRLEQALDVLLYDLPDDYFSAFTQHVGATTRSQVNAALQNRLSSKELVFSVVCTADELADSLVKATGAQSSEIIAYDADASEPTA